MRELSARGVSLCFPHALYLSQCEASEQEGNFQMDNQGFFVWVIFSAATPVLLDCWEPEQN